MRGGVTRRYPAARLPLAVVKIKIHNFILVTTLKTDKKKKIMFFVHSHRANTNTFRRYYTIYSYFEKPPEKDIISIDVVVIYNFRLIIYSGSLRPRNPGYGHRYNKSIS